MESPTVRLKQGKESIFYKKHHWIFSGAIEEYTAPFENGSILPVKSYVGTLLGYAYFNRRTSLCGRIVSFGEAPPFEAMSSHLKKAFALRSKLFDDTKTNAYRLINGEGDFLPGLIIDRYADYLVLQIGTLGMERLKEWLVSHLITLLPISGIYEKSLLPSRKEEGLPAYEGHLWGKEREEVEVRENDIPFVVSVKGGQKTGFFLDQREMRQLIRSYAQGQNVLNCFCYTGGFSLAALKGGATQVDSVDISQDALEMAKKNLTLSGFSLEKHQVYREDVFSFLKERPLPYDLVILDPPAFAKKKADYIAALKGYKTINREALKKMKPGSCLLTCSCSYYVDETSFQEVLFQSALEAKRTIKILSRHRLAMDHPINLHHPESNYLKSLFLQVN